MLSFFNLVCVKSVKNASQLTIDGIRTKEILFVPRLARPFTIEESKRYDGLTDRLLN